MHLVRIMFAFTIAAAALALPSSWGRTEPATKVEHPQHYYLSANCPQEPWHNRSIVALPTSQRLGLGNFTVAPTTPGLNFRPIELANGYFALRGDGDNDENSSGPFLVALKPTNGTQIMGMTVLHLPKADSAMIQSDVETCPDDFECVADQWTFDAAGDDMVHHNFKFAGSDGDWEPIKDAAPEGWHVYWKGGGGVDHPIVLDLVAADDHGC